MKKESNVQLHQLVEGKLSHISPSNRSTRIFLNKMWSNSFHEREASNKKFRSSKGVKLLWVTCAPREC